MTVHHNFMSKKLWIYTFFVINLKLLIDLRFNFKGAPSEIDWMVGWLGSYYV